MSDSDLLRRGDVKAVVREAFSHKPHPHLDLRYQEALAAIDAVPAAADDSPFDRPFKFNVGERVEKSGGDYRYEGIVVAAFAKLSGVERFVAEDDRGLLLIHGPSNLSRLPDNDLRGPAAQP